MRDDPTSNDGLATSTIEPFVLVFEDVDRTRADLVGGKGAHLGELSRIDGIGLPPGFCVTTHRRSDRDDLPEGMGGHAEAGRNTCALDPGQDAQVRGLATDDGQVRPVDIPEVDHELLDDRDTPGAAAGSCP